MQRDITLIILFAVMIFLFLCNFMSLGIVGDTLSRIMFGLVGFTGYFLPVFIFAVYLYYILAAEQDPKAGAKTGAIIGLFFIFMVFCHLVRGNLAAAGGYDPAAMWKTSSEERIGGGVIGGTIAYVLYRLLKMVGSVLVLLVCTALCIYVIGQRSFLELFRNKAMDARLAREERLEKRDEEARLRREHPGKFENSEEEGYESVSGRNDEPMNSSRMHYEETRERYEELRRARRKREAERAAEEEEERQRFRNAAYVTDFPMDSADEEEPGQSSQELDAPSIRGGQMAGTSGRKGKLLHFRGIVGDTSLSGGLSSGEESGNPDGENPVGKAPLEENQNADVSGAASFPENEMNSFSMPSDVFKRKDVEDREGTAAPADRTDSGISEADRQAVLRDSDELHEILPEDFLDEEEPGESRDEENHFTDYSYERGRFSAANTAGAGEQRVQTDDSDHHENIRLVHDTGIISSLYQNRDREKMDPSDPYEDLPEIEEIPGENGKVSPVGSGQGRNSVSPDDENTSAFAVKEPKKEETGEIAVHTDREAGPSEINQVLDAESDDSHGLSDDKIAAGEFGDSKRISSGDGPSGSSFVGSAEKKEKMPAKREYVFPPISLLHPGKQSSSDSDTELRQTARLLQTTLQNFGVNVTITDISQGPAVTRYEMLPEMGVKVSKIVSLADDIKLALAATDIRIEAPIPGKSAIGIEVPNREAQPVALRDILDTDEFRQQKSKIAFAVGKDIAGKPVYGDIAKMPHVLIAGATGSGKSVCINTIIMSILYHAKPEEVKLIMIDPKVVELSVYNGIPHLLIPVVTDPQKAAAALNWGVAEMEARYRHFADAKVRDIKAYNAKAKAAEKSGDNPEGLHFMPQIVIIVDELADLMMVAKNDVETAICRLAQLARAAGIYLIIATQRPSVDVITGLIKANMPSRIAFRVTSGVDSRTILDMNGAEKLLGKGDMLFFPQGLPKPTRVQGCFVSDEEVNEVVKFVINNNPAADEDVKKHQEEVDAIESGSDSGNGIARGAAGSEADSEPEQDELFGAAGTFIIEKNNASIGLLQRRYRIGFNRAARIMDQLCDAGVVGDSEGTKSRNILMTMEQFLSYCQENGIVVPDAS